MGGFTGYYTHRGEGGEPDLWEGELPIERAGYVTDLLSERAVAFVEAAGARSDALFPQPALQRAALAVVGAVGRNGGARARG